MTLIKRIFLVLFCNYFYLCGAQNFNLTVIHINDIHSHFAQINAYGNPCDEKSLEDGKCFGGAARNIYKVWHTFNTLIFIDDLIID